MKELRITNSAIQKALDFATKAHEGVPRKQGDVRGYITHPVQVATLIQEYHPEKENAIIGALLHDTVEDCEGVTLDIIEDLFGNKIRQIVAEVTDDESNPDNLPIKEFKKQRRQKQVDNLKNISLNSKLIRLGDKISNTVDILEVKNLEWQKAYVKFMRACYEELKEEDSALVKILDTELTKIEIELAEM